MSNRFFVEGCLLTGCVLLSLSEGPMPLIVGIVGVIMAEVAIDKMKRSNFIGKLDGRARRRRGRRRRR